MSLSMCIYIYITKSSAKIIQHINMLGDDITRKRGIVAMSLSKSLRVVCCVCLGVCLASYQEWIHLKITKLDLRNNYIMLYDLICKNWQNVIAPKGRHHSTTQAALY